MAQITEPGIQLSITQPSIGFGTIYYAVDGGFQGEWVIEQKISNKMVSVSGSRLMFLTNEVTGNSENLARPTVQYWG